MRKIDFTMLDGRTLRTFLTVLEEMSVSKAAARLGVTQSAVSHTLDRLRAVFGDPLFVRSGRGILATERARALRDPAQSALDSLKALTEQRPFDPKREAMNLTVAANDFPRRLFFPPLLKELAEENIDISLRFVPSGVPSVGLLRDARCQLLVTPLPPEGPDIHRQALFQDRVVCFYDADMRDAPKTWEEYTQSDHIEVRFPDNTSTLALLSKISEPEVDISQLKAPRIAVPNFSDLGVFLRGTRLICYFISSMKLDPLKGFGVAPLPFPTDPVTVFMVWHRRDHTDPAHRWFRQRLKDMVDQVVRDV
jgi:DNA-binding transcriptional LysR family regulator